MFDKMRRYELLDHTADIGIIAFGRDLSESFANAAYAMFDMITDIDKINGMDKFDLQVSASSVEELLVTWLDELLYRYETERFVCSRFIINRMDDRRLCASIFGENVDPVRHEIKAEIKSVTYHQLKIEKLDDGWRVQVIFDV
jgi:SHS2 domain-containing protein